jgi:alkylation response protein AidB-like acyl-CoA dehydrogenase
VADRPSAAERRLVAAARERARAFLRDEFADARFTPTADSWMHSPDAGFSRRLAAAGLVGTTIPAEFGGRGGTEIERFAIAEELVAVGAPVAAHWIAERQLAPLLLRFGTDEQRKRLLPGIARGEVVFSIGMSEPDAGSDLAAVRTRASWTGDGWVLTGRKVWTTNAHIASVMVVLARSDGEHGDRHEGLSQFVVDLPAEGITVQPIRTLDGAHHFNEVTLDDVRLSAESLLGERGRGWAQVNSELSFERSGPERFLSMVPVLRAWTAALPERPGELERETLGRLTARLAALRRMSFILVWSLQHGQDVGRMAASVKLLGNAFEQDVVESVSRLMDRVDAAPAELVDLVDQAVVAAPAVSLRGGASEILRTIVARGLVEG